MSKKHYDTKVKPIVSEFQKPEKVNRLEIQNVLSKKNKPAINFDDKKYGVKISKIDQYLSNKKQESFGLRAFLSSIPVIGRFLVKIFTPEKGGYKKLQSQIGLSNKAKNEIYVDNRRTEEVGSKLENGNIEQVDKEKKNLGP
ncbi:hypothetical protein [Wolbachia endosymbiont of Trichogramma pretiosum]|uniref:hypothetical protein n=1 Tax=Wolbachia endosymbiont of Trichogramma pretiosum TaxID=125593 RepID=UPI0008399BAE|nr:hypothetical protein [Wolbachia endosymbiont of Trichogramma pretiosum]OCA06827.1 hypothetical protein wTpre_1177 [Wolbachia endosymbiont of Trichogramma pretiosum]